VECKILNTSIAYISRLSVACIKPSKSRWLLHAQYGWT